MSDHLTITEAVRERYAAIAAELLDGQSPTSCCGSDCCGGAAAAARAHPLPLYEGEDLEGLPAGATLASLGCGSPTSLAALKPGEIVLDLGSGGGMDVLLAARQVGPTGFVYGLDMTDEMLALARQNAAAAGATNVAFLRGRIEAIPLPDAQVDVILSNCVINLAADKGAVLREAHRVLKPGGRLALSDIVIEGGLPADFEGNDEMRRDLASWAGCLAGALSDDDYRAGLAEAGFRDITLTVTGRHSLEALPTPHPAWLAAMSVAEQEALVGRFVSMAISATR